VINLSILEFDQLGVDPTPEELCMEAVKTPL